MTKKLAISHQTDTWIILAVDHAGTDSREIDVSVEFGEDGGIIAGDSPRQHSLHGHGIWLHRQARQRTARLNRAGFSNPLFFSKINKLRTGETP